MNARDRLAAIAARAEAATNPGPLFFVDVETGEPCPTSGMRLCTIESWRVHRHRDGRPLTGVTAAQIVHTDLPALVAFATAVLDRHVPVTAATSGSSMPGHVPSTVTWCGWCQRPYGVSGTWPCADARDADELLGGAS